MSEEEKKLYEEFQEKFPIEKLRNMALETYTDIDNAKGFSFWIINKIFGNTNYKSYKINLGIYKYTDKAKFGNIKNTPHGYDDTYAWQYDNDRNRAFSFIKQRIFDIATNAKNYSQNQDRQYLKNIDEIDLPPVYKWKIAFLYSGRELIDCYSVDKLKELFQKLLPKEKIPQTISDLQYQLVQIREKNPEEFNAVFASLWGKNNNNEDKTMTDKNTNASVLAKNLAELLKNTKNLILHGAPGTGKTYLARKIAEEMNAEVGFVQFHPSYDYTDFVEGIRPTNSEDNTVNSFKRQDGIFKKFCEKALKTTIKDSDDNFDAAWNKLVETLNNQDYIDIPLSKSNRKMKIELNEYGTGLANRTYKNDKYKKGDWISGLSKFFNKDQLYNIYKGLPGVPSGGHDNYRKAIVNYMKDNMGLLEYKQGTSNPEKAKPFIFIIDEINRGELSKIFGELFFAIDPGYRGEKGKILTQYANMATDPNEFDEVLESEDFGHFFVPENVYIIGTMNDIDRSVESMDLAMRRRFTFKEITAENSQEAMLTESNEKLKGIDNIDKLKNRMSNLNEAIIKDEIGLSTDYQIGAAYFLKYSNYMGEEKPFDALWEYNLAPLLKEYLRGQDPDDEKFNKLKKAYENDKNPKEQAGEQQQ